MGEVLAYAGRKEDASSTPGLVRTVLCLSRDGDGMLCSRWKRQ